MQKSELSASITNLEFKLLPKNVNLISGIEWYAFAQTICLNNLQPKCFQALEKELPSLMCFAA